MRPYVPGPQLVIRDPSLGGGYDREERAVSDSFGAGEWDDRKVRHAFIRKVRHGPGGRGPWAPQMVGRGGSFPLQTLLPPRLSGPALSSRPQLL